MRNDDQQLAADQTLLKHFEVLWQQSSPPDVFEFLARHPAAQTREVADVLLCDLSQCWQRGTPRPVQDYFYRLPEIAKDAALKAELIEHDFRWQQSLQAGADLDSYLMQFPDLQAQLRATLSRKQSDQNTPSHETIIETPLNGSPPLAAFRLEPTEPMSRGARIMPTLPIQWPAKIGRYSVRGVLGGGSFGVVYDGFDDDLQRPVAIKVPKQPKSSADALKTFRTEAQHLAQMQHPGIVAVHDFGVTDDGQCYVVTERIDGETLTDAMRRKHFTCDEAAELVAQIADALHYAHCRQIVHRDVKPANILLDRTGRPHVADFGLALNEVQQRSVLPAASGTPAYMPPEQVRGEARYLDGRSDIWSLGVILYEILTQQRPFQGVSPRLVTEEVVQRDPKPLRILNPAIPMNLEQACLRCLEKNKTQRFAMAADLAQELRRCVSRQPQPVPSPTTSIGLRVATCTQSLDDGFPIVTCTVINRSEEPLVIVSVRAEVTAFRPLRGQPASRELVPTSRVDIVLPAAIDSHVTSLLRPIFVSAKDAMSLELRLVLPDAGGKSRSPGVVGGFKYRLVFLSDLGTEASTDELSLGRGFQ